MQELRSGIRSKTGEVYRNESIRERYGVAVGDAPFNDVARSRTPSPFPSEPVGILAFLSLPLSLLLPGFAIIAAAIAFLAAFIAFTIVSTWWNDGDQVQIFLTGIHDSSKGIAVRQDQEQSSQSDHQRCIESVFCIEEHNGREENTEASRDLA